MDQRDFPPKQIWLDRKLLFPLSSHADLIMNRYVNSGSTVLLVSSFDRKETNMIRYRILLVAFCSLSTLAGKAPGEDFRIETDVFFESSEGPAISTLTLFRGSTVYDFMENEDEEITIFDINRGRFVLLDCQRKVKTTVTTEQLKRFSVALKAEAKGNTVSLVSPEFIESFDQQAGTLELVGKRLQYKVKTIRPPSPEIVDRYRKFADWYARLNATRVGNLPPFARMQLNATMANHGILPRSVERTISSLTPLGTTHQVRTSHLVSWQLTNTDRKRISRAGDYMATYRDVSPASYWKRPVSLDEEK